MIPVIALPFSFVISVETLRFTGATVLEGFFIFNMELTWLGPCDAVEFSFEDQLVERA